MTARRLSEDPVAPPPGTAPDGRVLEGQRVRLEPVEPATQAAALFEQGHADAAARDVWTYMPYGPFDDLERFAAWQAECAASRDPLFYAIRDKASDRPVGQASFLRVTPVHGSIEIGHIWFVPGVQRSPVSTEALFLMMRHAFDDLGNRRLEWKCNALNQASRSAALRLGFSFEGIFHQHMVVKGRNRDTAWYAILDGEWPAIRANFEAWLSPDNFDADGRQKVSLASLNDTA